MLLFLTAACASPPPPKPPERDWSGFEPETALADGADAPETDGGAEAPALEGPREIPVVPNRAPPYPYVEVTSPNWEQFGVGLLAFGLSYTPGALLASHLEGNAWTMQIPVAGPFLQLGASIDHVSRNGVEFGAIGVGSVGLYFVGLVALGTVQAGGLVLAVHGLVTRERRWLRSDFALVESDALSVRAAFLGDSLTLTGRF